VHIGKDLKNTAWKSQLSIGFASRQRVLLRAVLLDEIRPKTSAELSWA